MSILIANNLAALALTGHMDSAMSHWPESTRMMVTTLALTPLLLIFGEFLPKQIFRQHADQMMPSLAVVLWLWRQVCSVPVWMIGWLTKPFVRGNLEFILPHDSRPALRHFLVGEGSGHTLDPLQQDLVNRVMAMERLTVSYSAIIKDPATISVLDGNMAVGLARRGLGTEIFSALRGTRPQGGWGAKGQVGHQAASPAPVDWLDQRRCLVTADAIASG